MRVGIPSRDYYRATQLDRQSGRALDENTRATMEAALGQDFSQVRVHSDSAAAASARAIHTDAYTYGRHIVFGGHVVEQTRGQMGTVPVIQGNDDRPALRARLQAVRARLAQLRAQERRSTEGFTESVTEARQRTQRESLARITERGRTQSRIRQAATELWGGTVAAARIRRAVTATQSGNTVTLSVNLQIAYAGMSDRAAQQRAQADISRIESAIRGAWQVDITSGEYAGISFRVLPRVTYLRNDAPDPTDAFVI